MIMTSICRSKIFVVFASHHMQLFSVLDLLSLHQVLNHLSIEYHLDRPSINLILIFAAAYHIINALDVLLVLVVSGLKVRLPPFPRCYKVLILSLHPEMHILNFLIIMPDLRVTAGNSRFCRLDPRNKLLLQLEASREQVFCLLAHEVLNASIGLF